MLLPIFHILWFYSLILWATVYVELVKLLQDVICNVGISIFQLSSRDKTAQFIAVSHILVLYLYFIKVNIIQRVFSIALYGQKSELKLSMKHFYETIKFPFSVHENENMLWNLASFKLLIVRDINKPKRVFGH